MKYGFGIDLGGTTVKIAYLNENGTMLDKWEIPTVTANGGAQIISRKENLRISLAFSKIMVWALQQFDGCPGTQITAADAYNHTDF